MLVDKAACRQRLVQGIDQLQLVLPEGAQEQLLSYLDLLARWNSAYNLTAVREPLEMVSRHLLDSLAVSPYIKGPNILDLGSGAGLPGIPLSIARPECRFTLMDGNGKKVRFIRQVVLELGLDRVMPLHQRVEENARVGTFQQITARAFSDMNTLWKLAQPLLQPGGKILAFKGTRASIIEETKAMTSTSLSIHPLHIPFLEDEQRHLVILTKEASC